MRGYHSLHNRIKYPHSLAFFFYRNERIYGKNHHVGFRATTSTQPTGAEVRSRGLSANGTNFGEFFQKINKSLRSLRLRGESFSIHPLNSDSRLTIHGSRLPFLSPESRLLVLDLLIMVSCLQEIDLLIAHQIDQPMLLGNAARPGVGHEILERLRFSDARKWIAGNGFNQLEDTQCGRAISLNPKAQVFHKLGLEDELIRRVSQDRLQRAERRYRMQGFPGRGRGSGQPAGVRRCEVSVTGGRFL